MEYTTTNLVVDLFNKLSKYFQHFNLAGHMYYNIHCGITSSQNLQLQT